MFFANVILVVLAVVFAGVSLVGDTWDEDGRRLTRVGIVALVVLILTASAGFWREWLAARENRETERSTESLRRDLKAARDTISELREIEFSLIRRQGFAVYYILPRRDDAESIVSLLKLHGGVVNVFDELGAPGLKEDWVSLNLVDENQKSVALAVQKLCRDITSFSLTEGIVRGNPNLTLGAPDLETIAVYLVAEVGA